MTVHAFSLCLISLLGSYLIGRFFANQRILHIIILSTWEERLYEIRFILDFETNILYGP